MYQGEKSSRLCDWAFSHSLKANFMRSVKKRGCSVKKALAAGWQAKLARLAELSEAICSDIIIFSVLKAQPAVSNIVRDFNGWR